MQKLLNSVIKKIKPDKNLRTKLLKIKEVVFENLKKVLPKDVEIAQCGSVAKDTYLKDKLDLDVFLLFDSKYSTKDIKKLGLEYAKKAFGGFKTKLAYAQHPYLQVFIDGIKIDIVPSSKILNYQKLKTQVDRSQLHTKYVLEKLKPSQNDEVRLLKKFTDTLGVYGSSSKIEGFSGYLCELLILKYGSFLNLLEAAAKEWKKETVIDLENYYTKEEALKVFAPATFIVIDPTDKKRNVAAVVSRTSFSRFVYAARKFLLKPSIYFFFPKENKLSINDLKNKILQRKSFCFVIMFENPDLVEDVLWPQLRKSTLELTNLLEKEEYRIIGYYFYADEKNCLIMFELMEGHLPHIKHLIGPEIFDQKNIDGFIKKHKNALNIHLEHYRIVAIEKRKYASAIELIKAILKKPSSIGIPKGISKSIKNARIYSLDDLDFLLKQESFLKVAKDYFLRKIS